TAVGEFRRALEIATGEPQLAQAREEAHRVAPAHPLAGAGVVPVAVRALEVILRLHQIALGQVDLAQVDLSVRIGAGAVPPLADVGARTGEGDGAVEIAELRVQPAEAVEQAMVDRLVADLLGEAQPLPEQRQRALIVALGRESHPVKEEVEEKRYEKMLLP